jgi:hypothetical protein
MGCKKLLNLEDFTDFWLFLTTLLYPLAVELIIEVYTYAIEVDL